MTWYDMIWHDMTWYDMIEGSLEVKLPTIWTDGKAEQGRGREKRKIRREKIRRERVQRTEDTDARKGRKVANHCVFPMICGSGGLKSRLAKAAGAEPRGQMREEKLHAIVAWSTVYVSWTHSGIRTQPLRHSRTRSSTANPSSWKRSRTKRFWAVEKVHAVVARSTFWSQKSKKLTGSEHFWTFRCPFAWQAQGIMHFVKSEQKVMVCSSFKYKYNHTTLHLRTTTTTSTTTLHYTCSGGPELRIWKIKIYK